MRKTQLLLLAAVVAVVAVLLGTAQAHATTNQFRGVNWADPRDNFQSGVVYVSGLSSSDTYASASATGTSVMTQFVSKLGANAVRMPINEATVSGYWGTYTGAIDAVLSKGSVILCYWDSAKTNKPPDMTAFWNMWKTVVDKYGGNGNAYFEIFNEPNMYSTTDLDLAVQQLARAVSDRSEEQGHPRRDRRCPERSQHRLCQRSQRLPSGRARLQLLWLRHLDQRVPMGKPVPG